MRTEQLKLRYWLYIILPVVVMLISCDDNDKDNDNVTPNVTSKLDVTVSPNTIIAHEPVTITWSSNNLSSLIVNNVPYFDFPITVNGIRMPDISQGVVTTYDLSRDTTFTFIAVGKDKKTYNLLYPIKVNALLPVVDRTKTLTDGYWNMIQRKTWGIEVTNSISYYTWSYALLSPGDQMDRYYFRNNGRLEFFTSNMEFIWSQPWKWSDNDSISINNYNRRYILTDSTLLLLNNTKVFTETRPTVEVYKHRY